MTVYELQNEIIKLKKEKKITILAHSYQSAPILEIADYTGDSFRLSQVASLDENKTCIVCGVHFMAETVKLLSPEKDVILAHPHAGCPMAEQFTAKDIRKLKEVYPNHTVVAYVNTTAELKTLADVCVTSSSSVKICSQIENDKILFIPDCNLGSYTAKNVPGKEIVTVKGGCPVHSAITLDEALEAKAAHPNAKLLVHPECIPEVTALADFAGSTADIMKYARSSDCREFIIGTENSIAEHLQYELPEKDFYILSSRLICPDMKATTLMDVYNALIGKGGVHIEMSDELIEKASVCINRMLEMG
ncbi:MAG: quinolinate synthase NadA [Huintestinicola sp.]